MVLIEMGKPSNEAVERALEIWEQFDRYRDVDIALYDLFHNKYPDNENLNGIIIKASVLNDYYSTNIFNVYSVSKHIQNQHIDKEIRAGDPSVVDKIRYVTLSENNERDFYSFATKYCCHHNSEKYPIFDTIVRDVLMAFNKEYHFSKFKKSELREYRKFLHVLDDFSKHFQIDKTPRELDRYLWLYGKEVKGTLQKQYPSLSMKRVIDHRWWFSYH